MPFNFRTAVPLVSTVLTLSCGALGEQEVIQKIVDSGTQSCLNDLSQFVEQLSDASISTAEWQEKLDCTIDSVKTLKKFSRGSQVHGFATNDVHVLLSKLLITDQKVSLALVENLFRLKSAALGGSSQVLQYQELDQVIRLLESLRDQGVVLLPKLKSLHQTQSLAAFEEFSKQLQISFLNLAETLADQKGEDLTLESMEALLDELKQMSGVTPSPHLGSWIATFFGLKALAVGGSARKMESWAWERLLGSLGTVIGPLAAWLKVKDKVFEDANEGPRFVVSALNQARSFFERALLWNQGHIPFTAFDQVIEHVPFEHARLRRESIKSALRPIFSTLFGSRNEAAIDNFSLSAFYHVVNQWERGKTHLDSIYEKMKLDQEGVTRDQLVSAAQTYRSQLARSESNHIERLIRIINTYRPIFKGDEERMSLVPIELFSQGNLSKMHAYHLLASVLVNSYGGAQPLTRAQFERFFSDFGQIFFDLKMVDITVPDIAIRRYSEASLFTYASNGDDVVDVHELTYYIGQLNSIKRLVSPMYDLLETRCSTGSQDPRDIAWMDAECFRSHYFQNVSQLWSNFEALLPYYDQLAIDSRQRFQSFMEKGARRKDDLSVPLAGYDTENYAGILHYVETIFDRFDANSDGWLNHDEQLVAFDVFKHLIILKGSKDGRRLNERSALDVFTFMLKYGFIPDAKKPSHVLKFVSWVLAGKLGLWKLNAQRSDIYRVAGNFVVTSEDVDKDEELSISIDLRSVSSTQALQ